MIVYIAKCTTSDPEVEGDSSRTAVLGIFSAQALAEESFTHKEKRIDKRYGEWIARHSCYKGNHRIEEYEIDKWSPLGLEITAVVVIS